MLKPHILTSLALIAGAIIPLAAFSQEEAAEGQGPAAAAAAANSQPRVLKPEELKWDENLMWISFIVDDGRVQSNRDYFGAIDKADFDALVSGGAKGMIRVQQVFYYNPATRQFSRFDASSGGAIPILAKSGYFRPESMMRMVPLNRSFVENLAVRGFLNVAGE